MSATSTRPSVRHWFHRLVSGQPHQVIGIGHDPYMHRWYLIPPNPWVKVYVHKFLRSDDDRALHDHPWSFVSVMLRGSYREIIPGDVLLRCAPSIAFRPAQWRHRVQLDWPAWSEREIPCWTLIITGPHVRTWGFWCKTTLMTISGRHVASERFVPWQEFGDAGCGEP